MALGRSSVVVAAVTVSTMVSISSLIGMGRTPVVERRALVVLLHVVARRGLATPVVVVVVMSILVMVPSVVEVSWLVGSEMRGGPRSRQSFRVFGLHDYIQITEAFGRWLFLVLFARYRISFVLVNEVSLMKCGLSGLFYADPGVVLHPSFIHGYAVTIAFYFTVT